MQVFDIMTFFQSSAIKAWKSRGIELPESIITGKAGRATFTWGDIDEVRGYCFDELRLYVELANRLRDEFREAKLPVSQWHGPGAVANAAFKKYGIKDYMKRPPAYVEEAAQGAYFGGRFEQFKGGHYEGKVYVYDINSAYPDKIRDLPSLAESSWEWVGEYSGPGVYYCSYDSGETISSRPHPIPWRGPDGTVAFPPQVAGVWLWHPEAVLATTIHYGYRLVTADETKPFSFVPESYDLRQKWKAEDKGGERALKLMLNSLYGKTAQRVGGRPDNDFIPQYHQLEWAGMVTSATRAQLWEAISKAPENIIAVETDSVASTVPLDLPIGPELGAWELETYDNYTYIQSGVYFAGNEAGQKIRSRGIDVTQLDHAEVMTWLRNPFKRTLEVFAHDFIGLGNPRMYHYGQWLDTTKQVRIGGGKRIHMPALCDACSNRRRFDQDMHTMTVNPMAGQGVSSLHPLPWLEMENQHDTDNLAEFTIQRGGGMLDFSGPRTPSAYVPDIFEVA